MAPHSNTVDISLFITYTREKGDAFFRFDKMTIMSRTQLAEDARILGLPPFHMSDSKVITPGKVVRILWKDVRLHERLHKDILDTVQPVHRREREINNQKLAELDIVEVKLAQDPPSPIEDWPYSSPSKRPYEPSDRYHSASASSSPYKRPRKDSQPEYRSEKQYDDRNTSYSESRSHSGADYGTESKPPTSLIDRVKQINDSAGGSLVERISPAPATFKPLANRLDNQDPSPLAAPPLSARISDPAPSTSNTGAHLRHHNISLPSNHPTPAGITPSSSLSHSKSSEGTPATSGEVHPPPADSHSFHGGAAAPSSDPFHGETRPSPSRFAPRGGSQTNSLPATGADSAGRATSSPTDTIPRAGSSSRFGPALDAPPINTRLSSIASSRQVTPRSALQAGVTPSSFPLEATGRAPSEPPKEESPAPATLGSGVGDANDTAVPSPAATSTSHDRVESQPPATALEGQTTQIPPNVTPMDVDTRSDAEHSERVETRKLAPPFSMPPLACSTNAQNEMLRAELSKLSEELKYTKQELENERRRRKEAEAVTEDVMRECREPFVVPALMDAFMQVSKLTTTVRKISS